MISTSYFKNLKMQATCHEPDNRLYGCVRVFVFDTMNIFNGKGKAD